MSDMNTVAMLHTLSKMWMFSSNLVAGFIGMVRTIELGMLEFQEGLSRGYSVVEANMDVEPISIELDCGLEGGVIHGELYEDDTLEITEIGVWGEGSGTFMDWILEPALAESVGVLEAVLIWEGGDSITRLIVEDGKVKHEDVEL